MSLKIRYFLFFVLYLFVCVSSNLFADEQKQGNLKIIAAWSCPPKNNKTISDIDISDIDIKVNGNRFINGDRIAINTVINSEYDISIPENFCVKFQLLNSFKLSVASLNKLKSMVPQNTMNVLNKVKDSKLCKMSAEKFLKELKKKVMKAYCKEEEPCKEWNELISCHMDEIIESTAVHYVTDGTEMSFSGKDIYRGYAEIKEITSNIINAENNIFVYKPRKFWGYEFGYRKKKGEKGDKVYSGEKISVPPKMAVSLKSMNGNYINIPRREKETEVAIIEIRSTGESYMGISGFISFINKKGISSMYINGAIGATKGTEFETYIDREKGIIGFRAKKKELSVTFNISAEVNARNIEGLKSASLISDSNGRRSFTSPSDINKKIFQKKFTDYEQLLQELNNQLRKTERGDTLSIVSTRNNIGRVYFENGEYDSALDIFMEIEDQAVAINDQVWIAIIQNNIGAVWYEKGRYDNAIRCYEKALKIDREIFGEKHPETAITYDNISLALSAKGGDENKANAEKYIGMALEIDLKIFGKKYSKISTRYNTRGFGHYNSEKYDKAMLDFSRALRISKGFKGASEIAIGYNNLASAWRKKGRYDEAIQLYMRALETLKRMNPDKRKIVPIYNNLGLTLKDKAKSEEIKDAYRKAAEYYRESVICLEEALDILDNYTDKEKNSSYFIDRTIACNGLGYTHQALKDHIRAESYFDKAIKFIDSVNIIKERNIHKAISYNGLGLIRISNGEYKKAIETLKKVGNLNALLKSDTSYSVITIDNYNGLGKVYQEQGKYEKATDRFKEAQKISVNVFGKSHPKTKLIEKNIKMLKRRMGS